MINLSRSLSALALISLVGVSPAPAVTETSTFLNSQDGYTAMISSDDLINAGQTSVLDYLYSNGTGLADAGTGFGGIFDGTAINDQLSNPGSLTYLGSTQFGTTLNTVPSLTVNFNLDDSTGGSSTGYTLTGIQSINGWRDWASMSDQHYTISISTDPAQLEFSLFHSVDYHPFNPANDAGNNQPRTSLVTLTNLNVSGVTAIRFTFSPYNNGSTNQAGQLIREIDVFGTPTAVPEPSAFALLGVAIALGGFGLKRWSAAPRS